MQNSIVTTYGLKWGKKMDLDTLEKELVLLEADSTCAQTETILANIPQLKQDLIDVKSQLDKLG